jgi:hypothetical protein
VCGHPPVSTPRMRPAGSALWLASPPRKSSDTLARGNEGSNPSHSASESNDDRAFAPDFGGYRPTAAIQNERINIGAKLLHIANGTRVPYAQLGRGVVPLAFPERDPQGDLTANCGLPPRPLPLIAHTCESGPEDAVWPSAWWLPPRGSGLAPLLRDNTRQVVPLITTTPNLRRNETHRVAAFPSAAAGPIRQEAIATPPARARFAYCARQTGRRGFTLPQADQSR